MITDRGLRASKLWIKLDMTKCQDDCKNGSGVCKFEKRCDIIHSYFKK